MIRSLIYNTFRMVETLLFVSVITALVWLYAEAGNVVTRQGVKIEVRLTPPAGRPLRITPELQEIALTFSCATDQLTPFSELTQKPIPLEIVEDPAGAQQTLVLKDKLQALPAIAKLGLNIENVQPATLSFHVEAFKNFSFPVHVVVPPSISASIVSDPPPAPRPATAAMYLPEGLGRELTDENAYFVATLNLDAAQLKKLTPNVETPLDEVPLSLPAVFHVTGDTAISPAKISILYTIHADNTTSQTMTLPVLLCAQPADLKLYDITILPNDSFVSNISFTGPSSVIAKIQSKQTKVWFELQLSSEEIEVALKKGGDSKTPDICKLPPDVALANVGGVTPVHFTVVRRQP